MQKYTRIYTTWWSTFGLSTSARSRSLSSSIKSPNRLSHRTLMILSSQNDINKIKSSKFISDGNMKLITSISRSENSRYIHLSGCLFNELRDIVVPALAESLSEGDIRWMKAVGDSVAQDEVVGEVETDKTSVPIHCPVAGVIEELLVEDGSTVQPGNVVLRVRVGAAAAAPAAQAPPPKVEAAPEAAAAAPPPPPPPAAAEPSPVPISSAKVSDVKAAAQTISSPPAEPVIAGARTETRVKMNRMRQRIAQRLKDAQNTYAMLTTFNEIDMTRIMEMRNLYKDAFLKKHNLKLSFMSAFIKASAFALQDQPVVNAVIEGTDVLYRDYIDISVAVSTPKGLVVPVLRNVEQMNFAQIERGMAELAEKARKNTLAIEDMDGGTFTISNGGVFGSMFGTPIINPPQSAILGMHAIIDRPVVIDKKIEIRPMMYVCLTYDHRLIDGREAVTFLRKIKSAVEDPRVLMLDI